MVRTKVLLLVVLDAVLQINGEKIDFDAIFHSPQRNYDDFEILERSNFEPDDPKPPPRTSNYIKEEPKAIANAQVLLTFPKDDRQHHQDGSKSIPRIEPRSFAGARGFFPHDQKYLYPFPMIYPPQLNGPCYYPPPHPFPYDLPPYGVPHPPNYIPKDPITTTTTPTTTTPTCEEPSSNFINFPCPPNKCQIYQDLLAIIEKMTQYLLQECPTCNIKFNDEEKMKIAEALKIIIGYLNMKCRNIQLKPPCGEASELSVEISLILEDILSMLPITLLQVRQGNLVLVHQLGCLLNIVKYIRETYGHVNGLCRIYKDMKEMFKPCIFIRDCDSNNYLSKENIRGYLLMDSLNLALYLVHRNNVQEDLAQKKYQIVDLWVDYLYKTQFLDCNKISTKKPPSFNDVRRTEQLLTKLRKLFLYEYGLRLKEKYPKIQGIDSIISFCTKQPVTFPITEESNICCGCDKSKGEICELQKNKFDLDELLALVENHLEQKYNFSSGHPCTTPCPTDPRTHKLDMIVNDNCIETDVPITSPPIYGEPIDLGPRDPDPTHPIIWEPMEPSTSTHLDGEPDCPIDLGPVHPHSPIDLGPVDPPNPIDLGPVDPPNPIDLGPADPYGYIHPNIFGHNINLGPCDPFHREKKQETPPPEGSDTDPINVGPVDPSAPIETGPVDPICSETEPPISLEPADPNFEQPTGYDPINVGPVDPDPVKSEPIHPTCSEHQQPIRLGETYPVPYQPINVGPIDPNSIKSEPDDPTCSHHQPSISLGPTSPVLYRPIDMGPVDAKCIHPGPIHSQPPTYPEHPIPCHHSINLGPYHPRYIHPSVIDPIKQGPVDPICSDPQPPTRPEHSIPCHHPLNLGPYKPKHVHPSNIDPIQFGPVDPIRANCQTPTYQEHPTSCHHPINLGPYKPKHIHPSKIHPIKSGPVDPTRSGWQPPTYPEHPTSCHHPIDLGPYEPKHFHPSKIDPIKPGPVDPICLDCQPPTYQEYPSSCHHSIDLGSYEPKHPHHSNIEPIKPGPVDPICSDPRLPNRSEHSIPCHHPIHLGPYEPKHVHPNTIEPIKLDPFDPNCTGPHPPIILGPIHRKHPISHRRTINLGPFHPKYIHPSVIDPITLGPTDPISSCSHSVPPNSDERVRHYPINMGAVYPEYTHSFPEPHPPVKLDTTPSKPEQLVSHHPINMGAVNPDCDGANLIDPNKLKIHLGPTYPIYTNPGRPIDPIHPINTGQVDPIYSEEDPQNPSNPIEFGPQEPIWRKYEGLGPVDCKPVNPESTCPIKSEPDPEPSRDPMNMGPIDGQPVIGEPIRPVPQKPREPASCDCLETEVDEPESNDPIDLGPAYSKGGPLCAWNPAVNWGQTYPRYTKPKPPVPCAEENLKPIRLNPNASPVHHGAKPTQLNPDPNEPACLDTTEFHPEKSDEKQSPVKYVYFERVNPTYLRPIFPDCEEDVLEPSQDEPTDGIENPQNSSAQEPVIIDPIPMKDESYRGETGAEPSHHGVIPLKEPATCVYPHYVNPTEVVHSPEPTSPTKGLLFQPEYPLTMVYPAHPSSEYKIFVSNEPVHCLNCGFSGNKKFVVDVDALNPLEIVNASEGNVPVLQHQDGMAPCGCGRVCANGRRCPYCAPYVGELTY